jgi:hypothetical protein
MIRLTNKVNVSRLIILRFYLKMRCALIRATEKAEENAQHHGPGTQR